MFTHCHPISTEPQQKPCRPLSISPSKVTSAHLKSIQRTWLALSSCTLLESMWKTSECIINFAQWLYRINFAVNKLTLFFEARNWDFPFFWCKTWVQNPYHFAVSEFLQKALYWWSDTLQRELHLKALKYNAILFEMKVFPQTLSLLGDVWNNAILYDSANENLTATGIIVTDIQDGGYWWLCSLQRIWKLCNNFTLTLIVCTNLLTL